MKKNKIMTLGLSIALIIAMAGCTPKGTNMRNMSTQTRLYDNNVNNRWMTNAPFNARDRLNTNLNNGMVRNNSYLNDGVLRDNNYLNNNVVRDNTLTNDNVMRNRTNLDSGMITNDISQLSTRADTIARRVTALPEVTGASVIVHGNTAIVGCDVRGNTRNTNNAISSNLKQKVEAAVKTADRNIKKVSVTSDPSLYSRIRTMSTNIGNGHPISNFTRDIEDILSRITSPIR
ncbi:YhcN/YlaJ family sporulation lipoprotein [Tissierella praeacuta]|uniref:YhcN/YlaJ family sporulation lipoprotein n=1 Tax=Tissierella praeacuta TaxID=43131 RepID=UPI0028B1EC00|nr:YhcN/YlaJ family sporulation lipoprotein [Tissierella praeacuta]